jgi:hypothetical protein
MLDVPWLLRQPSWRLRSVARLQPRAQHPVEDQRLEAHQRMRTDAPGQPVVHRSNFDLALERAKPALNVGQALIALHDLGRRRVSVLYQQ